MNRKEKDLARMSALSYKAKESNIVVVEDINLDTPKTSSIVSMMSGLKLDTKKTLVLLHDYNENAHLSMRNIPNIMGTVVNDMNTYDILNADVLVMTESAVKLFSETAAEVEA